MGKKYIHWRHRCLFFYRTLECRTRRHTKLKQIAFFFKHIDARDADRDDVDRSIDRSISDNVTVPHGAY